MTAADDNKKLRELLWLMREEAEEGWRNVDPLRAVRHHAERDLKLRDEIEALIGPMAWDALESTTHIAWHDQAICHWTIHAPVHWPPTQTSVAITELIVRLPCEDDETYVEFVARPDANWNGVTCDACRLRLPTLLREMSAVLDDLHEGIMEGVRTHPETIRARELYERDVEPKLSPVQRQRDDEQRQRHCTRNERRRARRERLVVSKDVP